MSKRLCAIAVIFMGSGFELVRAQQLSDPNPAMNNPDKAAWDLFVELNRPALEGKRGLPDPNKKHGDPGPRVWETWKQTSSPKNEVFLPKGANPGKWDTPQAKASGTTPGTTFIKKTFSLPKMEIIRLLDGFGPGVQSAKTGLDKVLSKAPVLNKNGQESRINQPGFDFIVGEKLYSLDGQETFRKTGRKVEFPVGTINVKAAWRQFTPEEIKAGKPARYYTAEEDGKVWGLTGFHMTSKDIPNWLWATFEHVDNPPPEIPDLDRYTEFLYPRDPHPSPIVYSVEQRLRKVPEPLRNTVWQNYVLRGTQVDFVDSMGNSTLLANTQFENGMQLTASCIGCHSRSTIGDRFDNVTINGKPLYPAGTYFFPGGLLSKTEAEDTTATATPTPTLSSANRLTVNPAQVFWQQDPQHPDANTAAVHAMGAIGAPTPEWFLDSAGNSRYTQLDFIWGFIHAQRETGGTPTPTPTASP